MVTCPRCLIRWFDIRLVNGICQSCHHRDTLFTRSTVNQRREGQPYFWSADNALHPGDIPGHLPKLTQLEEWLVARVHVHVQVMIYRGQQYKYKGHVIIFLKAIGIIYRLLPRLPQDLDIIVLQPRNQTDQPHMIRQFRNDFRVRRAAVLSGLSISSQIIEATAM